MAKDRRASDKAPAYQWFPKDAESDEDYRLMTCEELGVYERLRDHQWIEGSIPPELEKLAPIVGHQMTLKRLRQIWPKVARCFPDDGSGRLANPRLERQRTELASYIASQKINGRSGGLAKAQRRSTDASHSLVANASSASATASPSASTKNPPPPLTGGRIKRAERKLAEDILKQRFGRCQHDPPHVDDREACLVAIVLELRMKRGAA